MPGVERAGDAATCSHPNTGSFTVFANDAGISKVGVDTAGGMIVGPGSITVFVNDEHVSLPGDVILPHFCCGLPGCSPHCAATTTSESTDVIAGTGFATSPLIAGLGVGGEGDDPDAPLVAAPDISITNLSISTDSEDANSTLCCLELADCCCLCDPPSPGCLLPIPCIPIFYCGAPPVLNYTVKNTSLFDAGPFTVGIFRTPNEDNPGWTEIGEGNAGPYLLTDIGVDTINNMVPGAVSLISSALLENGLQAGAVSSLSYTIDIGEEGIFWSNLLDKSWYSVFPDIHAEVFEPNEDNTVLGVSFAVT